MIIILKEDLNVKEKKEIKCNKCKYKWKPRKKNPKECPRCKNRLDSFYETDSV